MTSPPKAKKGFLSWFTRGDKKEDKGDNHSDVGPAARRDSTGGISDKPQRSKEEHPSSLQPRTPSNNNSTDRKNSIGDRKVANITVEDLEVTVKGKQDSGVIKVVMEKENGRTPDIKAEKKIILCSTLEDLPEDCQKLINQAKIPIEKMQLHFDILLNVLHFRTGKLLKRPEDVTTTSRPPLPQSERFVRGEELITELKELKKKYKDIEEVGKGGFGTVFHARSIKEKKMVAIKKMAHKTKKQQSANFHEASILNYCNHPNIVKFLTMHDMPEKEEIWLVMEYLEGGTFEEAAKNWQFNEANLAYVAKELLKGISYLHANNLMHRDLKSANIMMSVKGEVKLIDFGLCADLSVGEPQHMVGSPFWMPPEMIQCKPHNQSVDIWSFAISLLEMANQTPPMIESAVKAMFTVGTEGVSQLFTEPDKWSVSFKSFLGRCLKMDPAERATAEELLQHPFLKKADTRVNMENILRKIFLSNSLINSGF